MKRERFQEAAQRKATQKWFGDRKPLNQWLPSPKTLESNVEKMEAPSLIPSGTPKTSPRRPNEPVAVYLKRLIREKGAPSA